MSRVLSYNSEKFQPADKILQSRQFTVITIN